MTTHDSATNIRTAEETAALVAQFSREFNELDRQSIEAVVRAEFDRRQRATIQDFVPVFVERAVRSELRALTSTTPSHERWRAAPRQEIVAA